MIISDHLQPAWCLSTFAAFRDKRFYTKLLGLEEQRDISFESYIMQDYLLNGSFRANSVGSGESA